MNLTPTAPTHNTRQPRRSLPAAAPEPARRVVLHIERMVLQGLSVGSRRAFVDSFQRTLRHLLAQPGGPKRESRSVARLRPPPLRIPPRSAAGALGAELAMKIYRSLDHGRLSRGDRR